MLQKEGTEKVYVVLTGVEFVMQRPAPPPCGIISCGHFSLRFGRALDLLLQFLRFAWLSVAADLTWAPVPNHLTAPPDSGSHSLVQKRPQFGSGVQACSDLLW